MLLFVNNILVIPFTPRFNNESVDEILWCDHLNETSSTVLLHGTTCFLIFDEMKFVDFI